MEKKVKMLILCMWLLVGIAPFQTVQAAPTGIIGLIRAAVTKAIVAMDLRIQRLQNRTIWLQNAQKVLENALSKLKLDEIASWSEKQKEQYRIYYEELTKVKALISYYQRISEVAQKQTRLIDEYNRSWNLLQQDSNFTSSELEYMNKVYTGILRKSVENIDQIAIVIESFSTSMGDAKRIDLINKTASEVDATYSDLLKFNNQNLMLTRQRAKERSETESVRKLYGLP